MASHVSQCMAKACMCVTHGMPCVTMHGLLKAYIKGVSKSVCVEGAAASVRGSSSKEEEEGKRRRRRKGEEKGRKGKEEGRKGERRKERRKEKKKGEEERKKKEEEEGVLCSEQPRTAKNPELRYKR